MINALRTEQIFNCILAKSKSLYTFSLMVNQNDFLIWTRSNILIFTHFIGFKIDGHRQSLRKTVIWGRKQSNSVFIYDILRLVRQLKFQNITYQVGDNIRIRSDINCKKDLFAKILVIIQAKNITPFPLIYVAWYE